MEQGKGGLYWIIQPSGRPLFLCGVLTSQCRPRMGNRSGTVSREEIVSMCDEMEKHKLDQLPRTLTGDNAKLVLRVWNRVSTDIDRQVAVNIFKSILSKSEEVRSLFGVSDQDYTNLETSGRYVSHARLVKNALTLFIQDLNKNVDSARITETLRSLGARHVTFRKEGFQPDFWYIFAVGIIDVSKSWSIPIWKRSRFERIWRELICFVIVNMRRGYERELSKAEFLASASASSSAQ